MTTESSYNGWPASTTKVAINVKSFVVAGVDFPGGVRAGDVATVLGHVALQFNNRVEKLKAPGCWGYSYRRNRNADNLSCHSSGTAIDVNAPAHPNGVEATKTYSKAQIAEIHKILMEIPELSETVHWGGDWHAPLTPDGMHFEIHEYDLPKLARVAKRIKTKPVPLSHVAKVRTALLAVLDGPDARAIPTSRTVVRVTLTAIRNLTNRLPKI